ncbi:MAG: ATP-binding cassette domain-containing protein [Bacteroidales bacterium]|nr:ATP-binding cassette domain-containing protein [Bacteroidales bacterium]
MIEVINLFKSFPNKSILEDISLVFEQGKTNLVIGQSGSGKTVLIKCIVGLVEIDSGQILYNNRPFNTMNFEEKKSIRQEIGMIFQGGALFDSMNVEENISFPLKMFTNQSAEQNRDRTNFCLKRVNLENVNKLYPAEISGGMKKRVSIARAIALNPKYLFCDEPTSGLDPKTSVIIDNLISEITEEYNITTVINTHDMNSVFEIGQTIAFINKGKLWWRGNKDNILNSNNNELNDFILASQLLKKLKK